MSLAANALLTLLEFKGWMGIGDSDTSTDTLNGKAIDSASQNIETVTGRKWITPAEGLDEIFSGNGQAFAYSVNVPILTLTDLSYLDSDGSTWVSVTGDRTYAFDAASGRIYFTDGNVFTYGDHNWRATYTYGYAVADVPDDLKMACAILAARIKKQFEDGIHGVSSKSFGDQSISFSFNKMPDNVREILERYKRKAIV